MKREHNGKDVISRKTHNLTCGHRNLTLDGENLGKGEGYRALYTCDFCGRYIRA